QRVASLVMYLNTPPRGGATNFPDVGLEVAAVKGNAVFFSYDKADPSTGTLHGGMPVIAGEKWVATKWLRVSRTDP
ncbi:MAG: 2-oxoglutarate-dependent dioxygenase, partial [Gammaproteobacteria bacterium]|nr:2-oxoglutarate-dependent dioxygenase [Gammaproteobacteria bacterium]